MSRALDRAVGYLMINCVFGALALALNGILMFRNWPAASRARSCISLAENQSLALLQPVAAFAALNYRASWVS
jgi:hypothetical protein